MEDPNEILPIVFDPETDIITEIPENIGIKRMAKVILYKQFKYFYSFYEMSNIVDVIFLLSNLVSEND